MLFQKEMILIITQLEIQYPIIKIIDQLDLRHQWKLMISWKKMKFLDFKNNNYKMKYHIISRYDHYNIHKDRYQFYLMGNNLSRMTLMIS